MQKRKSQWMLKITEYAQRLIDDLDDVNYLEKIKTQQKNWIGRSEGAEVKFKLSTGDEMIVYTTREIHFSVQLIQLCHRNIRLSKR